MHHDDVVVLIEYFNGPSMRLWFMCNRIVTTCEGYQKNKQYISKDEFSNNHFKSFHICEPMDRIYTILQQHQPKVLSILESHPNARLTEYHEKVSEFMNYYTTDKDKFISGVFDDEDVNTLKINAEKLIEPSKSMWDFDYSTL